MNTTIITRASEKDCEPVVSSAELADVLQDEIIIQEFGKNGKLSNAQKAILLAERVKSQNRERQLIEEFHRSQIGIVARMWKFMGGPIVEAPCTAMKANDGGEEESSASWKNIFTMRNVMGGGAVLIVAFGFLVTNLTHNYKEKAKSLENETKALAEENRKLEGDAQKERTRGDAAERALTSIQGAGTDVQQKLLATIDALSKEKGEAARATAAGAEKTYQKLYDAEKKERLANQKKYEELLNKNQKLMEENATLKAKQPTT